MASNLADHLDSLHSSAIDAQNGCLEALDDAGGKDTTTLFTDMVILHSVHADELNHQLQKLGEGAEDSGSFMSNVRRTIISVRALFHGLGGSVLPGLIDGEQRNVGYSTDVLNAPGAPDDVTTVLVAERGRIEVAI